MKKQKEDNLDKDIKKLIKIADRWLKTAEKAKYQLDKFFEIMND